MFHILHIWHFICYLELQFLYFEIVDMKPAIVWLIVMIQLVCVEWLCSSFKWMIMILWSNEKDCWHIKRNICTDNQHVKQYDWKFKHCWVVRKSTIGNLNAMFGCKNTTDQMNMSPFKTSINQLFSSFVVWIRGLDPLYLGRKWTSQFLVLETW